MIGELKQRVVFACALLLAHFAMQPLASAQPLEVPDEIVVRGALAIAPIGSSGRSLLHTDPLELAIVRGEFERPQPGKLVQGAEHGGSVWQEIVASEKGELGLSGKRTGYVYAEIESAVACNAILEASGHSLVYVDGVPRTGDPYSAVKVGIPIKLIAGKTPLLFVVNRGAIKARVVAPPAPIYLDTRDATLPDLIEGEQREMQAALVVVNSTEEIVRGLDLVISDGAGRDVVNDLPPLLPLSARKIGVYLPPGDTSAAGAIEFKLLLGRTGEAPLHQTTLSMRVRAPSAPRRVTFESSIDGSVQYYALSPVRGERRADGKQPALFLTLHGAGVEAIGHASAYAAKEWGDLVAPTNRRPFGFDWEDWGRRDAMEVLELAAATLDSDRERIYLSGHSMGGHGAWHLGVTFPDRFAAIAPSAGWISFFSYGGAPRVAEDATRCERLLARANNASDTLALLGNVENTAVSILHGGADDNVPASEARTMVEKLRESGAKQVEYHEEPDAGHWWDDSEEPGASCVDWPPFFDLFARHALPRGVRAVDFSTASPGISSRAHWVEILSQQRAMDFSRVKLAVEPQRRRFFGQTENVLRLGLDLGALFPGDRVQVDIDGTSLEIQCESGTPRIFLKRGVGGWSAATAPSPDHKNPLRYGPFREVIANRVALVYGTAGSAPENEWSYAKARLDSEIFWVRGNGSLEVISDAEALLPANAERNLVLYGNAATNRAWSALLGDSPVQVTPGLVTIGEEKIEGDDLLALVVRPRPGTDKALVAAIAGTGITGMRLADRLPLFISGIPIADFTVLSVEALTNPRKGLRAAGYFDASWRLCADETAIER